jgi:hypothetical protein
MATSFSGGGSWREPPTLGKQLVNFITWGCESSAPFFVPYLGLHNVQDFAQILYFVGGVRIINRNNVFHSFPDREITCPPCFFVYYCQYAKLNIS